MPSRDHIAAVTQSVRRLAPLCGVAILAIGCGQATLDVPALEGALKRGLTADVGVAPKAIECPTRIEMEKGTRLQCTGTAPNGETFVIDVELTNDSGGFKASVPRSGPR